MHSMANQACSFGGLVAVALLVSGCEVECADCGPNPPLTERGESPAVDSSADSGLHPFDSGADASGDDRTMVDASSSPGSDAPDRGDAGGGVDDSGTAQEAEGGGDSASQTQEDADGIGHGDAAAARVYPGDLLDLSEWKVTVPVDTAQAGNPDEYKMPGLLTLSVEPYFRLSAAKDAVVFQAHAGGATTPNSRYPRSELREMTHGGKDPAAWSTSTGVHRMKVRQAITAVTPFKPQVVSAQIHDSLDDVVMVRLENQHLFVEGSGEELGTLEQNYVLGTVFTVEFVAANDTIEVFYNEQLKLRFQRSASGCYFKAGCYTQSNTERGDLPEAYAQVVIYELRVSHE